MICKYFWFFNFHRLFFLSFFAYFIFTTSFIYKNISSFFWNLKIPFSRFNFWSFFFWLFIILLLIFFFKMLFFLFIFFFFFIQIFKNGNLKINKVNSNILHSSYVSSFYITKLQEKRAYIDTVYSLFLSLSETINLLFPIFYQFMTTFDGEIWTNILQSGQIKANSRNAFYGWDFRCFSSFFW